MERIKAKSNALLAEKKVEPNSDMGKALLYLLKHWEPLTLFLRVPGAPLENNVCERALKMAIRHRTNSLFYKSERGARVGDLYMTLIETTVLNGENPFEYLTVLQRFATEVAQRPADWLPWTFRETLASLEEKARHPEATSEPTVVASPTAPQPGTAAEPKRPSSSTARVVGGSAVGGPTPTEAWETALRAFAESGEAEGDAARGARSQGSVTGRARHT
jgi:hypothetical protein